MIFPMHNLFITHTIGIAIMLSISVYAPLHALAHQQISTLAHQHIELSFLLLLAFEKLLQCIKLFTIGDAGARAFGAGCT